MRSIYVKILVTELTDEMLKQSVSNSVLSLNRSKDGNYVFLEFKEDIIPVDVIKGSSEIFDKAGMKTELASDDWGDGNSRSPSMLNGEILTSVRIEEKSSVLKYIGETKIPNALTSDPVWRISRISKQGKEHVEESANSGRFDQVWDNRASLFSEITLGKRIIPSTDYNSLLQEKTLVTTEAIQLVFPEKGTKFRITHRTTDGKVYIKSDKTVSDANYFLKEDQIFEVEGNSNFELWAKAESGSVDIFILSVYKE